jgi:nitrogen fixation protein NifU and related proteins
MSLDELYREVILDHYRNPRSRGALPHPDHHGEGYNPLCGDEITIDLHVVDGIVTAVGIEGQGCSISQASASMMAEAITGRTLGDVGELAGRFTEMMSGDDDGLDPERPGDVLGDLEALRGVRQFPVRIKCATLGWFTMLEALGLDTPPA